LKTDISLIRNCRESHGRPVEHAMRFPAESIPWMVSAFSAALCLAVTSLAFVGTGQRGTDVALQVTGRLSFMLFLSAYTGSAMVTLFGPAFQHLKQHARDFGLAFAAAHLVHLGLVGWLCWIGAAPPLSTFVFFGVAAAFTYIFALFSMNSLNSVLGVRNKWLLWTVGLNYIAYAFAVDFLNDPLGGGLKHVAEYLPFATLAIFAPILRLTAFALRIAQMQKISWS
jgi:hypothetical protein